MKQFIILLSLIAVILVSNNFANAKSKSPPLLSLMQDKNNNLTTTGCWPCSAFPPGSDCCVAGELCNDGSKCCTASKTNPAGCQTSCTPKCGGPSTKCGNGGCPMLPSTTCGTCDASKFEECDLATGTCVPAPICYDCFSGDCCIKGEMCPGNTPCCSTSKHVPADCFHNCTPNCKNQECGFGGCKNHRNKEFCGSCADGNVCSPQGQCVCPAVCDCGAGKCKGCPPLSSGCGGIDSGSRRCSCLGPKPAANVGYTGPKTLVYKAMNTGIGCKDNRYCGGYIPINSTTATPYQILFEGDKGGDYIQSLMAVFEAPGNRPFAGDDLFIYFGKNSTTQNTCARPMPNWLPRLNYPPFQIEITNCQQTVYPYCYNLTDARCFEKDGPENCQSVYSTTSIGNDRGFWIKNPGTPKFTVIISLTDYYYECGAGNVAIGQIQESGLSLQYVV